MPDYIIQKAIDRKDMSAKALKAMADKEYVLQPKWDGCHLVIKYREKEWVCESATGEPVRSCDHIAAAVFDASGLFSLDGYAVTGEVWVPETPFPEISGAFRRHSSQPHLKFVVLDVVKIDANGDLNDATPWRQRQARVLDIVSGGVLVPRLDAPNYEAEAFAIDLKNRGGFDGAILRDRNAPYKVGRCRNGEVIKIKPLLSYDLEVVGAVTDTGEKTGKNTAALIVRFKDNKYVKVATGLTQAQVDDIHANLQANWHGKIVEVEAMAVTEDGSLREPRFKGVRHDKDKPDF